MLTQLAVWFGAFIGAVIKQAGPEVLAEGIRRAFRDTSETGKVAPGDAQQHEFDALVASLRDKNHPPKTGDGGSPDKGGQGG